MSETDLPRNLNGDPEFASLTIKFDDIFAETGDVPARYSTDVPEVALAKVFAYYGEQHISRHGSTLDLVHKGAQAESIYVYAPATKDQTLNVILGTGTLRTLIDHPKFGRGSFFVMLQKLAVFVASAYDEACKARGGTPPLLLIEAETAVMAAPQEAPQQEQQTEPAL